MLKMLRFAGAVLAAGLAASCVLSPGADRREAVARRIADDASAFNEAYGQAVSGQILLNILRGRDRLPRHYLSMTGINDSPSLRARQSVSIGSIPFGEGADNWGFGSGTLERETITRPTYAVQPFTAETLTRTAFQPIAPYVFAHYWESGWPRDILVLLLVERLTVSDGGEFTNEANNIFSDCAPDVATSGCDFVRAARAMLAEIDTRTLAPFATEGAPVCGLIAAYGPARAVRPAEESCSPRLVVGARTYTLHLRSLDDAVYYVGELMRAGSMIAGDGPIEAQVNVRAAGLRGGGAGVPLFRVLPRPENETRLYAASVDYAGARYFAGPAIGRSCAEAAASGVCQDDASRGDRSSSVLSLLAELLALNQSPDAIRAPNRLFAE